MAEEQKDTPENPIHQEVNIDDLEVSVLMLVKSLRNYEVTATFLSRRGWPTKASSNLQKAIKIISAEKPDFILISLNFPHPSIIKLGALFAQTFKAEIIWFSESMDAGSLALLSKLNGHKLTGGASGPNLHRTLRKILQQKLNPSFNNDSGLLDSDSEIQQSNLMTVKGNSPRENSFEFTQTDQSSEKLEAGTYTLERSPVTLKKKKLREVAGLPEETQLNDETEKELYKMLSNFSDEETHSAATNSEKPAEPNPFIDEDFNDSVADFKNYEALHDCVTEALHNISTTVGKEWDAEEPTNEIYVIPVEHDQLPGYLVVKGDQKIHLNPDQFFPHLETILSEKINAKTSMRPHPGFIVKVPDFTFKDWVKKTATFTVAAEFLENKFYVAFIPIPKVLPKFKSDLEKGMLDVALSDISTKHPVNFKGYLRLEKNKKFLLYLKSGRFLLEEQKQRLADNNIEVISVKEIDEINLKRFFAFTQLQESILSGLPKAS